MRNHVVLLILSFVLFSAYAGAKEPVNDRKQLSLAGEWKSSLGMCMLPGTTDENKLGSGEHSKTTTFQLTRTYPYTGMVEYTREVDIPVSFKGKHLSLVMERTKPSTLWIDGDSIGSLGHIYAPHVYELPANLTSGKHLIKIRIDNSTNSVPKDIQGSHAWTDGTQTNWNGIVGNFYIEAANHTYINNVQVYPQVKDKKALVRVKIKSDKGGKATIWINGKAWNTPEDRSLRQQKFQVKVKAGENQYELLLDMGNDPLLWSEFHPALYRLNITIRKDKELDNQVVNFGMREFSTIGTQFAINGFKTFLRGKHDACVFPLTGYAPMDVEAWRKVFQIAKSYGINHYRCHSYTPPRAAFEAADIEGIYFHVELPLWGSIKPEKKELNDFLVREGRMILDSFGNHPSFMMLGLGNELNGDQQLMSQWVADFRIRDSRHLYSYGSNNNLGWAGPQEGEDFLVTCRVGDGEGYSTHTRTSFAFVDAEKGGILNNTRPSTTGTYSGAISRSKVPVISHESCQFQIYPDYSEIKKYTGVLYPYNLEIFRDRLKENNLTKQALAFHDATGRFAVECYKADMEYGFRTPGFGGFHILDLQDFPGQGSALVGILDAFMDSKGIVKPEVFRGFCAPVVPLAVMSDYCWRNNQTLTVDVALSNYTEADWKNEVRWSLSARDVDWARNGVLSSNVVQGDVTTVGRIELPLQAIKKATQLVLILETGGYRNQYNLWVYPDENESTKGIHIANTLDTTTMKLLEQGAKVLLIPNHKEIESQSVGALFTPDYWNYAMFKGISESAGKEVSPGTLSILVNPEHPLFSNFPTENHSDWQWWSIIHNSRPMILNNTPAGYTPLIQVVDNVERNYKLGLLFEFAVNKGKLLVCMSNLANIQNTPEGVQFQNALIRYMNSTTFAPADHITWNELKALFTSDVKQKKIIEVKNITDYTKF